MNNPIPNPEPGELWWIKMPTGGQRLVLITHHQKPEELNHIGAKCVKESWQFWVIGCSTPESSAVAYPREWFIGQHDLENSRQ